MKKDKLNKVKLEAELNKAKEIKHINDKTNRNEELKNDIIANVRKKKEVERLTALIKTKTVIKSISNADKMLPGTINIKVKEKYPKFNINLHSYLTYIFSIRPSKKLESNKDPFDTNTKYCYYDQTHKDYQYTNEWLEFILKLFEEEKLSIEKIKKLYKNKEKLEIQEYE